MTRIEHPLGRPDAHGPDHPVSGVGRWPLRLCLLSGGASRRMGCDKALLPHPEGQTWLERTLHLLAQLDAPITLFSRHAAHLQLAEALNATWRQGAAATMPTADAAVAAIDGSWPPPISPLTEPPPWEGPLLALHRLMERYPEQRLLLCPVDMPRLRLQDLRALLRAATEAADLAARATSATVTSVMVTSTTDTWATVTPMMDSSATAVSKTARFTRSTAESIIDSGDSGRAANAADHDGNRIHLAYDGSRMQPLLGIYPSTAARRQHLAAAVGAGERRLQRWLAQQSCCEVLLDTAALRNFNTPQQLCR